MNIFEFAMQMEKDGEQYYRELAGQNISPGLAKIFTMLANEEVKHYKVVERLNERLGVDRLADTRILENVKNVFAEMKDAEQPLLIDATQETKNYLKARDIEAESVRFYEEKAREAPGAPQFQIFLQLAAEEKKHLRIMENIVEFVSRPEPGNWLENAEWYHLDEY
jgi:rubrerythrin